MKTALFGLICASMAAAPTAVDRFSPATPLQVLITTAAPIDNCTGGTTCECAVGPLIKGAADPWVVCGAGHCIDSTGTMGTDGGRPGCCKQPTSPNCNHAAVDCVTPQITVNVISDGACATTCCGGQNEMWHRVGSLVNKSFGQSESYMFILTAACHADGQQAIVVQCQSDASKVLYQNTYSFHCNDCPGS